MISIKDKLLIRPWQEKRYDNHRRKVRSALPAIDTGPPPSRQHVMFNLKKLQKESERCNKIEKENYYLYKNLNYIMRTSRVDDNWTKPQPKFLSRVNLFQNTNRQQLVECNSLMENPDIEKYSNRKMKCFACSQEKLKNNLELKSNETTSSTLRKRSKSVPVRKYEKLSAIEELDMKNKSSNLIQHVSSNSNKVNSKINCLLSKETQALILNRGCLKLIVRCPNDTLIQFHDGNAEKVLTGGICNCKKSYIKTC